MIRTLFVLGGCLAVSNLAQAETSGAIMKSYLGIVDRNAFALKPVEPPPEVAPEPPPAQAVNIVFTATSNWKGKKKAYFKVPGGTPNTFTYPALQEGEQDGAIKVLEIDEKEGVVKILNGGVPTTLNFKEHGNKDLGVIAAPKAGPNAPGVPVTVPPRQPGVNVPTPNAPISTPIPVRPVRTPATAQATPQQNAANYLSSHMNIEVQRVQQADSIASGNFPPLPPTDLTEGN